MATTQKALEIMQGIIEELKLRMGAASGDWDGTFTLTFEALPSDVSDGSTLHPHLLAGDGTATHPTFRIAVKPIEWALAKDVLGLTQQIYTPHEILLGIEAVSGAGAEPLSLAQKAMIVSVLASRGCRLVVFESATGDSFDNADFVNAKKKLVFEPSTKYPMIQNQ